jgi:hypothetical protein
MRSDGAWINLRKLAASDIAFFGSKVIIGEFAAGVLLCGALGIWVLVLRDSFTQLVLGVYLIGLSINYVPMLIYAIRITTNKGTRAELGQELNDERRVMAKYRRQSLLLLVPFLVPILALSQKRKKLWHRTH